jgi:hypothetical protein
METIALAGFVVAACSLMLNAYLAYLLRNKRPTVSRNDDMRMRLFKLKLVLSDTKLIDVAPHYELWEFGFKSLEDLRTAALDCDGLLQTAPDGVVARALKNAMRELVDDIKKLYDYRDSYTDFSKGKPITSPTKLSQWKDFEGAKHALSILQTDYRKNMPVIDPI